MMYYVVIAYLLLPWLLLFVGAVRHSRRQRTRLSRFQVEGTLVLVAGVVAKAAVYSPHLELRDKFAVDWVYWFSRGEIGLFWVGLLMFGLGMFLERGRGTKAPAWPQPGKGVCVAFILTGAVLGLTMFFWKGLPMGDAPWSLARLWFSYGMYPFALGYNFWNIRRPD